MKGPVNGNAINHIVLALALTLTASASAATAQPRSGTLNFIGAEIPLGPVVRGAPYSAEALTTLTQTLGDGTRINRTVTAKLFRDSEGRVRREQTILGLGALDPSAEEHVVVTIVDPIGSVQYVLDPRTREARRWPTSAAEMLRASEKRSRELKELGQKLKGWREDQLAGAAPRKERRAFDVDMRSSQAGMQPLGHRQIEGVDAVGSRRAETIPVGRIGNDRPIEVTDERWESPELGLILLSQHHDPRTGDVEYRLTNISRTEPPHELFSVPADYVIIDVVPPPPPPPPPPREPESPGAESPSHEDANAR